jgi:hypothetical protein
MSKDKLNDMSIDPNTIKGGKSKEVESTDSKGNKTIKKIKVTKPPEQYISHHKGHGNTRNTVCVKKGDVVQKVNRKVAEKTLIAEGWNYCPRSEWKLKVRDATPVTKAS